MGTSVDEDNMTVANVLHELYELSQASDITSEGKPITFEEFQDMVYQNVDKLSCLLGIELKDWSIKNG